MENERFLTRAVYKTSLLLLFSILGWALFSQPGKAQTPEPKTPSDDDVNRVAKQLYCPVCENIPLDVCPTQACAEWRELIRQKLAAGWSDAKIRQYFVDQFGDRVLATPPPTGLNWLVYIIPPIAILAGVVIVIQALRSWRRTSNPPADSPPASASQDPYMARLEEELKKH